MPSIKLCNTWTDDDSMLQPELTVSNGIITATQDFYSYPEDLKKFGDELQSFPSSTEHVVTFEYGEDARFYCHVLLRAIVIDSTGHAALEVNFENRRLPPNAISCKLYLSCNPSTINELGFKLSGWVNHPELEIEHQWNDAR